MRGFVCCCSWAIIASKFKDKTTRQCRRRLVGYCSIYMYIHHRSGYPLSSTLGLNKLSITSDGTHIWTLISRKADGHQMKTCSCARYSDFALFSMLYNPVLSCLFSSNVFNGKKVASICKVKTMVWFFCFIIDCSFP